MGVEQIVWQAFGAGRGIKSIFKPQVSVVYYYFLINH